jgi:flavin reductase (DIM6/NTAB) family NADH-FMN oxidoreductase RutF
MRKEKIQLNEVEIVTKGRTTQVGAARMPRTSIIPVVHDQKYGLNAGAVSAGVLNLDPLHVIFSVKGPDSKLTYHKADEFVVTVPRRDQIDHLWVTACSVPVGINEIELAGWTELPSQVIDTPGIREVPLNLECKKMYMIQLDEPQRCILVGEVVGVSIDTNLLTLSRSDVLKQYPMHEATNNRYTGLYGPSVFSGELIPAAEQPQLNLEKRSDGDKTFVTAVELYQPENQAVAMNSIFPRPSYILMTRDEGGCPHGLPLSGGLIMSARPGVQIPVPKDSLCYKDIKRTGKFLYAITTRELIQNFEAFENNTPGGVEAAGFSFLEPNQINVPGIVECPVNVDCVVHRFEDVPGSDYAVVVGGRVGVSVDKDIAQMSNLMDLYCHYNYAVMDRGMKRKWGFHDTQNLTVKPLPSWGSRYHGGWWTGPEQYQAGMNFWLLELVQSGYIFDEEFFKIRRWMAWFRREGFPAPEPLWSEMKQRLTTILKMMLWAHRDYDLWHRVHEYLAQFPYEGAWKSP